jgi:hypothetical protein
MLMMKLQHLVEAVLLYFNFKQTIYIHSKKIMQARFFNRDLVTTP